MDYRTASNGGDEAEDLVAGFTTVNVAPLPLQPAYRWLGIHQGHVRELRSAHQRVSCAWPHPGDGERFPGSGH